jgi:hypothetical protein
MKKSIIGILIVSVLVSGCNLAGGNALPANTPASTETTLPTATVTEVSPTSTPLPTSTPFAAPGTVALDFVAQLCDAQWMNGAQHLKACPPAGSDLSGGYAQVIDPTTEELPAGTPVLATVVGKTSNAIFLRYPSFIVHTGDHFRSTLRCQTAATSCDDIDFRLEYFDKNGKYHSPYQMWKYNATQPPINVDYDLSSLAGQKVDFVLSIQSNGSGTPQENAGLWIAPYISRPNP